MLAWLGMLNVIFIDFSTQSLAMQHKPHWFGSDSKRHQKTLKIAANSLVKIITQD